MSWTPEGFIGAMFRTIAAHVPPPAGLASPMLWGTEAHLAEIFGDTVSGRARAADPQLPVRVPRGVRGLLREYYGPTLKAVGPPAPRDCATR